MIRKTSFTKETKRYGKRQLIAFSSAIIVTVLSVLTAQYICNISHMKGDISQNLLRLHITAENDEAENQLLKLCVRDRILKDFSDVFLNCDDITEAKNAASANLTEIKTAAEDELCRMGSPANVSVSVEDSVFPTKRYGDISLPRGSYTALKINIGNANGRNWWCVMYPPMCITHGNIELSEDAAAKLKSALTTEEYRLISRGEAPTVRLKFRIAEILGRFF